jgi:hypothetical protein
VLLFGLGEGVLTDERQSADAFLLQRLERDRRCCRTSRLDHTNRKKVGRERTGACANRTPSATTGGRSTSRAHSGRCARDGWSGRFRRLGGGKLLGHRSGWRSRRDFVVGAATAKIDEIGVVRVLQNSKEISLAQALAVATE